VHVVTILLIADQDRLEKLFDFVRDTPQIRFRVSHSLRQGSQDIAEETPDILFVQNHLSGLSGEIIARHLMDQVEGTKPRVVLFGETGQQPSPRGPLDACLDIARSDEELTAAIIGIIAETPLPPAIDEAPPAVQAEEPAPAPANDELSTRFAAPPEPAPISPAPPVPAAATVEDPFDRNKPPAPAQTPFDQQLKSVIEQAPEPIPLTEMEDTVSLSGATAEPPRPPRRRHSGAAGTRNRSPFLWAGTAAAAVVAVGAFLLLRSPTVPSSEPPPRPAAPAAVRPAAESVATLPTPAPPDSPAPTLPAATPPATPAPQPPPPQPAPAAKPQEPPAGTVKGLAQLPSFIPREGHDRDYGKSHPGWERYRGARTEFKVYRDGTAIRAVQTIDRSGVGIPESFFRGALGQMTNSREFTLEAKETQGKFRVEKGSVPGGARLVIYRTVPKGAIRAFVVHFN